MAQPSGIRGDARALRDTAIVCLMLEAGLSRAEVAALELDQLSPLDPQSLLRGAPGAARLARVGGNGQHGRTVELSLGARSSVGLYLQHERGLDAASDSVALFLAAPSDTVGRAGQPLSADSVDAIVGGERNLRTVAAAPGAEIPADQLEQIRRVVAEWTARNDGPHPRSASVVATTYDRVVPALHGSGARGWQARAVYLLVLEGDFVLRHALESGASSAPSGAWAAVIVHQSPPLQAGSVVVRPGPPDGFRLGDLGLVHSLKWW